jgi:diadenosine tetraphosphate (Ap4A) HIT family hydrolase
MPNAPNYCQLCRAVREPDAAATIYHNEYVVAMLDQSDDFHALVIPRQHVRALLDLPSAAATSVMQIAALLSMAIRTVSAADGLALWQDDPAAVGASDEYHFCLHLVPRFEGDARDTIHANTAHAIAPGEVEAMAERLNHHLDESKPGHKHIRPSRPAETGSA